MQTDQISTLKCNPLKLCIIVVPLIIENVIRENVHFILIS